MKLIDSHAHVNFKAFADDADEVIKRALKNGIGVVNVGSQYTTSKRAVEMAHKYPEGVWAIVGIHPVHLKKQSIKYVDNSELDGIEINTNGEKFDFEKYFELAQDEKVVAIGEVGLDYHHFEEDDNIEKLKNEQKNVLIENIKLANEVNKPVMIHCWDAYADLLEILETNPVEKKGVIHSFIGSYKTANKFIALGYLVGLNGIITYSESYDRLIREVGLENIIVETDCPYLTPENQRGERNEPLFVTQVVEKIARIKEISFDEVSLQTTNNVIKLFNI